MRPSTRTASVSESFALVENEQHPRKGNTFMNVGTRRRRLAGAGAVIAGASAVAIAVAMAASPASAASTLRQLAEAQSRYMGTAMTQDMLSNSTVTNIAGTQFDMVTPGN